MNANTSITIAGYVNIRPEDLGGVKFSELKVGDYIYSNAILGKIIRLTPRRAYVEIARDLGRQNLALPGASNFMGSSNSGLYVEDYGGRYYVTLPDEPSFNRLISAHERHAAEIAQMQTRLREIVETRAGEIVQEIAATKGLKIEEPMKIRRIDQFSS